MAQPPLSRQISQLEALLDTQLVVRERPIRLTDTGKFFYEQTRGLLQQLESVCDNTRRIAQGQRQRQWLSIGFAPSTLYAGLPEVIQTLRRDPDLELSLSEMTTLQQVDALKAGALTSGSGVSASMIQQWSSRSCGRPAGRETLTKFDGEKARGSADRSYRSAPARARS